MSAVAGISVLGAQPLHTCIAIAARQCRRERNSSMAKSEME